MTPKKNVLEDPFFVVGVGASAGGLEALECFCSHIPPDLNCAYVIVTHLDPTHKSMMPELLSRHTSLVVKQIESGEVIRPGVIYMIPPNRELAIESGKLVTIEHAQPRGFRTPINTFFNSLAREFGDRSIAVILSGSGTDGAESLANIKRRGGFVLVQNPDDAKYSGMPSSAIATGAVDVVESAQALPELILRYARKELVRSEFYRQDSSGKLDITEADLFKAFDILKQKMGHDFRSYKSSTLYRRLARRVEATKLGSTKNYLEFLAGNVDEIDALFNEFLINVTRFFRDEETFRYIEKEIIPDLVSRMTPMRPLRLWVAGCSTGEEAYSLAILVKERAAELGHFLNINLFATDLDADALISARLGLYPAAQLEAQVSPERIARYFSKSDKFYKINKSIRDMVIFSQHDLTRNPPLSKIDMVSCRNVMIYLDHDAQQKALSMFHYALKSDGYLVLGPSESLSVQERFFETLSKRDKCYRKNAVESPMLTKYHNSVPYVRSSQTKQTVQKSAPHQNIQDLVNKFFQQEDLPATAILDSNHEVVHLAGKIEGLFQLKPGAPSLDIFAIVDSKIHTEIRASVYDVGKNRKPVRFNLVRMGEPEALINIFARPLIVDGVDSGYTCLMFEKVSDHEFAGSISTAMNH